MLRAVKERFRSRRPHWRYAQGNNHDAVFEKTCARLRSQYSRFVRTRSIPELPVSVLDHAFQSKEILGMPVLSPRRTLGSNSEPMVGTKLVHGQVAVNRIMNQDILVACDDCKTDPELFPGPCPFSPAESTITNRLGLFPDMRKPYRIKTLILPQFTLYSGDAPTELVESSSSRDSPLWPPEAHGLTIECGRMRSDLAGVVDLVPKIANKRNSGALSPEPFDMSGLNFQSLKRVEFGTGSISDRMRE